MSKSKLVIAAAGSGKTTFLVNSALDIRDKQVLITTFTNANELEIQKKMIKKNGCIPANIKIQTWFSFLLQHGVKPYQSYITDKEIKGMVLVNNPSGIKYKSKGRPVYYSEKEVDGHYFTKDFKIYSDKISKFVYNCNEKSSNSVIRRLLKVFDYIFVDEVQDLAGYDLELINLMINNTDNLMMVGDPRQVTYNTHYSRKNKKYCDGKIKEYFIDKCKKTGLVIDEDILSNSFRCNQDICNFSSRLYPEYKVCQSNQSETTEHDGIFFVKKSDLENYLNCFNPVQLRDSRRTKVSETYRVYNFGDSKGLTFDRVLIYPTKKQIEWLLNDQTVLKPISKSKFYVALTRARYSVGIVYDYSELIEVDGIKKFDFSSLSSKENVV
jgi:DNA helicase-2/ATP-dependent DNA helicase PcrA